MTELPALIAAFTTLFIIIDPPGLAPVFIALTTGMTDRQRRAIAVRAFVVSSGKNSSPYFSNLVWLLLK